MWQFHVGYLEKAVYIYIPKGRNINIHVDILINPTSVLALHHNQHHEAKDLVREGN
jgi:hypothetical protein